MKYVFALITIASLVAAWFIPHTTSKPLGRLPNYFNLIIAAVANILIWALILFCSPAGAMTLNSDGSITYTKEEVDQFNAQTVKLLILLEKLKEDAEERPVRIMECI